MLTRSTSRGINDEVNLAVRERTVTQSLGADFNADLRQSQRITLGEHFTELLGCAIERQQ